MERWKQKMRAKILPLAFALVVMRVVCASAADQSSPLVDVQKLRDLCKKPDHDVEAVYCLGFVVGIADVMTMNATQISKAPNGSPVRTYLAASGICTPDYRAPSGGALIQAFLNWADRHPEKWGIDAGTGVGLAFQDTWRCKDSN